jgi:hypothetical protein
MSSRSRFDRRRGRSSGAETLFFFVWFTVTATMDAVESPQPAEPLRGRARACGQVAVLLLALGVCGCGGSSASGGSKLDAATVERAIATSILNQRHVHAVVTCPSGLARRAGLVFTCAANLSAGSYPVKVTETNSSGHVVYGNSAPLVILNTGKVQSAIERSILSQRHLRSTVACPAEVLQQARVTFNCEATVNGHRYPFAVTEVDGNGHVRYLGER